MEQSIRGKFLVEPDLSDHHFRLFNDKGGPGVFLFAGQFLDFFGVIRPKSEPSEPQPW